jgi:hypothetical protein
MWSKPAIGMNKNTVDSNDNDGGIVIIFTALVPLECYGSLSNSVKRTKYVKVGCLHPVACTRSGSGFPSNATLF